MAWLALWKSLPADITSIDSLPVFRHRLKNYLFSHSYPGAVHNCAIFYRGLEAIYIALSHANPIGNYYYYYIINYNYY